MAKGRGKAVAGSGGGGRLGADKETERLAKEARSQGWSVTVTGGNHIKWTPPTPEDEKPGTKLSDEEREKRRPVISGLTGVSVALPKLKSQLRRKGLHI